MEKYNSKEQFNKIKKISGELRDYVEKNKKSTHRVHTKIFITNYITVY